MVAKAEQSKEASATTAAAALGTNLTVATGRTGGSSSSSSSSGSGGGSAASTPRQFPHGNGLDCHGFDPVFAAICSDDKAAAAAAAAAQPSSGQAGSTAASTASSSTQPELSSNGKLQANILAACAAAVVGAVLEAPVELFKHRAQAGQIQGAMMTHVLASIQQHGPAALYGSFFIPFLFKSLPFDIGELMTYSSLNDWRAAAVSKQTSPAAPNSAPAPAPAAAAAVVGSSCGSELQHAQEQQPHHKGVPVLASLTAASLSSSSSSFQWPADAVKDMPDHVWDMAVGATAGAAAVMISMPPDCIKTVMVSRRFCQSLFPLCGVSSGRLPVGIQTQPKESVSQHTGTNTRRYTRAGLYASESAKLGVARMHICSCQCCSCKCTLVVMKRQAGLGRLERQQHLN